MYFFKAILFTLIFLNPLLGKTATNAFNITIIDHNPVYLSLITTAFNDLTTAVNSSLPNLDNIGLTKGSADASIIASKGLGVDYTNSMKFFLFGWGQGGAIALGSAENPLNGIKTIKGLSFVGNFNFGLNLGHLKKKKWMNLPKIWNIDLNKTKLYFNIMAGSINQKLGGYELGVDIFSLSVRAMTKIKKAEKFKNYFFKWGGIDLTSGLEYNKINLTTGIPINKSVTTTEGLNTVTTTFDGTLVLGLESKTLSLPLEISASAEFFSLLNFYWGLGADVNLGIGSGSGQSNSNVVVKLAATSIATGKASLDLGTEESPTIGNLRWFFGLQFNVWKMKTTIGLQHSLINGVWGLGSNFNFIY